MIPESIFILKDEAGRLTMWTWCQSHFNTHLPASAPPCDSAAEHKSFIRFQKNK